MLGNSLWRMGNAAAPSDSPGAKQLIPVAKLLLRLAIDEEQWM